MLVEAPTLRPSEVRGHSDQFLFGSIQPSMQGSEVDAAHLVAFVGDHVEGLQAFLDALHLDSTGSQTIFLVTTVASSNRPGSGS